MKGPHTLSIFSHGTERGTFVAYFLGAIVPLVVLGVVIERYVLAPIVATDAVDDFRGPASLALFAAISFLSFSSFLLLRKLARGSLSDASFGKRSLAPSSNQTACGAAPARASSRAASTCD